MKKLSQKYSASSELEFTLWAVALFEYKLFGNMIQNIHIFTS